VSVVRRQPEGRRVADREAERGRRAGRARDEDDANGTERSILEATQKSSSQNDFLRPDLRHPNEPRSYSLSILDLKVYSTENPTPIGIR
jgi:hypothetical protein